MSKKANKKMPDTTSSLSFSLGRIYRRITTTQPSTILITAVIIGYAIFLFAGGMFTIINRPPPSAYYNNRFYFIYPDIGSQFISDTFISAVLYLFGFIGLLAIYQSTKSAYKPRQAYMLLVIGVALLLLSYIFLEGTIQFKLNRGQ
jgi:hypothetical protein